MAVTPLQRKVCRLIAERLKASGERYVAGGVALNLAAGGMRLSRDIDLFHDTTKALNESWKSDVEIFEKNGLGVSVLREAEGFKEAMIKGQGEELLIQWSRDSAFRFFPLVENEELGLTLYPFDLATNKVLALAGRLEPRDWIDVLECNDKIQPLGYLAWAACAKDPGFNPKSLLAEARRSGRYSQDELQELSFSGPTPDAAQLGVRWHEILREAEDVAAALSGQPVGVCILESSGRLCRRPAGQISGALARDELRFHEGSIRGSIPVIRAGNGL
jgi:hypothetical protein